MKSIYGTKSKSFIDSWESTLLTNNCPHASKISTAVFLLVLLAMAAFNFWGFVFDLNLKEQWAMPKSAPAADDSRVKLRNTGEDDARATDFCLSGAAGEGNRTCDLSRGSWVAGSRPPLYTNDTCRYIFANQDCMTNGRPDREFLFWRWQPRDCDLPAFDARLFLRLMAGKRLLFVGDSLGRNHMQSLLCALAQVEVPQDVLDHQTLEYVWQFPSYNFTLASAWSSFLVSHTVENGTWHIHLDKPDEIWTSPLPNYDIAIFSTTYWFFRRSIYYVENKSISSYDPANLTSVEEICIMKNVWNTVLTYLVDHYVGTAVLRTVSVSHFDGNPWDKGGTCKKTEPDFDPDMQMSLPWTHNEIFNMQKDAFAKALERRNRKYRPCNLRLLDVTYNTLLRPDGHPAAYRIQSATEPRNDCTHWCLPGPIDTWNELLLADKEIMCS